MARGLADGPEEVLLQVKRVRPGVRLDCRQWAFLKTWR